MADLAGYVVNRLFSVGLSLDSASSIAGKGPVGDRVAAAADGVDHLIREIRDYVFAGRDQGTRAGLPGNSQQGDQERAARTADRAARQEHMIRAARALRASAAEHAALLERMADRIRPPRRMDYPAEIKRWRAFADGAEQMATRWEQAPLPGSHQDRASVPRSRYRFRAIDRAASRGPPVRVATDGSCQVLTRLSSGDGPLTGWAGITALLDPGEGHESDMTVPFWQMMPGSAAARWPVILG